MAAAAFSVGLGFISDGDVARPPNAKTRQKPPSNAELAAIKLPTYGLTSLKEYDGATTPDNSHTPYGIETPRLDETTGQKTPDELERSQPPTPKSPEASNIVPTFSFPKMNRWRVLSACLEYFGNGMNDSAPGALIPYIEEWYNIGYAVVSTIWISNVC